MAETAGLALLACYIQKKILQSDIRINSDILLVWKLFFNLTPAVLSYPVWADRIVLQKPAV